MTLLPTLLAAALLAGTAEVQPPASDPYQPGREVIAELSRVVTPNGIDDTFEATLGGARHLVNVRGADRANPIIVFLHGGPGAVEMPIAWAFQRPWEDLFTVVQYDQRGAGRSYALNDPATIAPTLTPERYRDDAIELIELLRRRYGQRRVILLGHSWGSIVGLSVAAHRPDLLHAYVGVGQVIDFRENERQGFDWTLAEARRRNLPDAVRELEALRPYPGPGAFDIAKLEVERRWNVRFGGLAWGRDNADFYFRPARLSPLYSAADRRAWDEGSAFTIRAMFPSLAPITFQQVRRLEVPVFMFLGRNDWTTPSGIAAAWLARVQAPRKSVIWFEQSAHLPFIEEPGHFFAALVSEIRPLARPEQQRDR